MESLSVGQAADGMALNRCIYSIHLGDKLQIGTAIAIKEGLIVRLKADLPDFIWCRAV